MSVAICSYQRRDSVVRLVSALDEQAQADPAAWRDVDVVVVLDGSTDGSREALEAHKGALPLQVIWQPNGGLASARNRVVGACVGDVILFLDDDLVPAPGTVARHRRTHESAEPHFLLGPCLVPLDFDVPEEVRTWWRDNYRLIEDAHGAVRFDQFGVANASGPRAAVHQAGGFDERFRGYGWEDFEFGARVLALGIPERYDPEAISWHYTVADDTVAFERQRALGRGVALTFQLHPTLAVGYFPVDYPWRVHRLIDRFKIYSPRALWAMAVVAHTLMTPSERLLRSRSPRFRRVAWDAAYLAGIADTDRGLLIKALGRPRPAAAVVGTTS